MWMLMIHQRLAMICLARLEQFWKSGMRRRQRFRRKHLPKQNRPGAQLVLLHRHAPIDRLGFAFAAWAALLVVVDEDDPMRHQHPRAAHPHPFIPRDRCRLPPRSRSFMWRE